MPEEEARRKSLLELRAASLAGALARMNDVKWTVWVDTFVYVDCR